MRPVNQLRSGGASMVASSSRSVAPGGSQRIDEHYGKKLIQHLHGKIENGVQVPGRSDEPWSTMTFFSDPDSNFWIIQERPAAE